MHSDGPPAVLDADGKCRTKEHTASTSDLPLELSDAQLLPKVNDGFPMDFSLLCSPNEASPTSGSIQSGLRSIYELAEEDGCQKGSAGSHPGEKEYFSLTDSDDGRGADAVLVGTRKPVKPSRNPRNRNVSANRHRGQHRNEAGIQHVAPSMVATKSSGEAELPRVSHRSSQLEALLQGASNCD